MFIIRACFQNDQFSTYVEILHYSPFNTPVIFEWRHDCPTLIEFINL